MDWFAQHARLLRDKSYVEAIGGKEYARYESRAARECDALARNISFALACVACIAACGVGPSPALYWFQLGPTDSYARKVLGTAGLWKERG